MTKVKLTRLKSNHQNLRTTEVEGSCQNLPEIGQSFIMFGKGLEFGTRFIETTPVISINKEVFKTENSEYKLEIIK